MQILQGRSARSDLPMYNAAMKQLGIQPEVIRNIGKHEVLPTHDLHVGQSVMYQDNVTKWWHPVVITSLGHQMRSYMVNTSVGVVYRKMQAPSKPWFISTLSLLSVYIYVYIYMVCVSVC